MGEPQPPVSGAGRDRDRGRRSLPVGEIVKFGIVLLASVGLGSAVDFFRERSTMPDREKGRRHVIGRRRRNIEAEQPHDAGSGEQGAGEAEQRQHAEDATLAEKRAIGHETSDAKVSSIMLIGVGAAVFLTLVVVGLLGLFSFFMSRPAGENPPASALTGPLPTPAEPRLQVDPPADWEALRATEEALLSSYGRADSGNGAVRIPIDRAMDLLAQRGLPVRSGSTLQFDEQREPNLDSSGGQDVGPTTSAPQATTSAPQPTGTPQSGGTGGTP